MNLKDAVEKLRKNGAVKIQNGFIWLMTQKNGETILVISYPTYHTLTEIKDINDLENQLRFMLNRAEVETEGDISISGDEIRM